MEAAEARAALGVDEGPVPYLPREVDEELRNALKDAAGRDAARLIVLSGPSKAGKSRTLLEAAASAVGDGLLIVPNDAAALSALAQDAPPPEAGDGPYLIWLDDIEPFAIRGDDGLARGTLTAFDGWPGTVLMLATQGGKGKGIAIADADADAELPSDLLARSERFRLTSDLTESEVARVRHRHGESVARWIQEDGIGEFMTVAPRVIERLEGTRDHPEGRAVTWAAIDCQRLGLMRPLPEPWLEDLYRHYLRGSSRAERFSRGLSWATSPLYGKVALLTRETESGGFRPHHYLVDYVNRQARAVKPAVLDRVIQGYAETGEELFRAGMFAMRAEDHGRAEAAYRRADAKGHCEAALGLGDLLQRRSDADGAQAAYLRADERGSADAAFNLGILLEQQDDLKGAEAAYGRSDERGSADAAFNLGVLLEQRDDVVGAEAAYRRADQRGHRDAALQLGVLFEQRQDLARAEAAYRRARELGHADAAFKLAAVLEQREYTVLGDQPYTDDGDPLDFARVAGQLRSLILRSGHSTPFTIGIEASWGRGKSSLMGQLERQLQTEPRTHERVGRDRSQPVEIRTVPFNAWTAEGSDVLEGLIKSVLDAMDPSILRRTLRNKKIVSSLRIPILIIAGWLRLGSLADEVWGRLSVDARSRNEINRLVREAMENWTAGTGSASPNRLLVVFIDDLDRCSGQNIVKVFEALKLYLNAPGFVFVVGYDEHVVSKVVSEEKLDRQISGRDYLEKIVQTVFRIPRPSVDQMDSLLQQWLEDSKTSTLFDKQQRMLLIERNSWNPRLIKRFVNRFILEYRLDDAPESLTPELLIKLLIIEAYFPDFARLFDLVRPKNPIQEFLDFLDVRTLIRKDNSDPRVREVFDLYGEDPGGNPQEALQRLQDTVPPVFVDLVQDSSFVSLARTLTPAEQDLILRRVQRRGELGLRPTTGSGSDGENEAAYRVADERGNADAAAKLGVLLEGREDVEGAEAAYRRADERGDAGAAFDLGVLLERRGDVEGAEAAYRRADERGSADAAVNLGVLLEGRGDVEGAEAAYRRADERGNANAAANLGVLLEQREDVEGAEAAYRRADERGNAGAASNLGVLLEQRGDVVGAEAAYRRADERGNAGAAFSLGVLLEQRGDVEGAEAAYRRADQRGNAGAAFSLGVLLEQRGDVEGAEAAYRRSEGLAVASKQAEVAHRARGAFATLRQRQKALAG